MNNDQSATPTLIPIVAMIMYYYPVNSMLPQLQTKLTKFITTRTCLRI